MTKLAGKPLTEWAQQVWMLSELEDKKLVACAMVDEFDHKNKIGYFKNQIQACYNGTQIDQIVTNIMLFGSGLGSYKRQKC